MKKLILVLAIALIASPAFALNVTIQRVGDTNVIDVNYSGADPCNPPRAFALDIKIMSGAATFYDVTDYNIGESGPGNRAYGIYPATIVIDGNAPGSVVADGTPLADSGDPGAGALGSNRVVLEFASLYKSDANAPVIIGKTGGRLCKLIVKLNGQTANFDVNMIGETTYRGGLVLEDGTTAVVDSNIAYKLGPPLPGLATNPYPAINATGIARAGVTMTWTAGSDATSHDVYFGTAATPTVLKGTTTVASMATGTMVQGQTYYWRVNEKNVTGTTTGTIWNFTVEECLKSADAAYSYWKQLGKPNCFCYKKQCKGDANGAASLGKRVTTADLTTWKAGFNKTVTQLKGVVDTGGVPAICGDFTHSQSLSKPITTADLTIWKSFFNKAESSIPQCASTNINFWTN